MLQFTELLLRILLVSCVAYSQYARPLTLRLRTNPCDTVRCVANTKCEVVDGKAKCVPVNETTSEACPPNEVFTECGTACEPSCTNPKPEICTLQCVVGCQCKPGFLRDKNGDCVEHCENDCRVNEERKECGTACEPTCEKQFPICTDNCITDVCQCKKGYIREQTNGSCIAQKDCPKNDTIVPCSKMNCPKGTKCVEGRIICPFVPPCFTSQTQCVPDESNGETCDMKQCPEGTVCEEALVNCISGAPCPKPPPRCVQTESLSVCAAVTCPVGSFCRPMEVVCVKAPCLPVAECYTPPSSTKCGQFETLRQCSSHCEPSCTRKNPVCILSCGPPKCQCNSGFYRNTDGSCVTENECDSSSDITPYKH